LTAPAGRPTGLAIAPARPVRKSEPDLWRPMVVGGQRTPEVAPARRTGDVSCGLTGVRRDGEHRPMSDPISTATPTGLPVATPTAIPAATPTAISAATPTGGWGDAEQVAWYTNRIGKLDARLAAERVLADLLPASPCRVLDLGCGDGRLAALVLAARPSVEEVVAVDISRPMMDLARERFAGEPRVELRTWNLNVAVTPLGAFDVVVSGFAIHHLEHERKRELFGEVARQLRPGGLFANLEVVASATPRRHAEFLVAIGRSVDDPEDRLASVDAQLGWMRDAGLDEVECIWRWRGFALLAGERTASTSRRSRRAISRTPRTT
jgi:tRNA (cmo5U34)-methyltransferase